MKIISDNNWQWRIHFFSNLYSSELYKNYNSIKELCEDLSVKRNTFEIYKTKK